MANTENLGGVGNMDRTGLEDIPSPEEQDAGSYAGDLPSTSAGGIKGGPVDEEPPGGIDDPLDTGRPSLADDSYDLAGTENTTGVGLPDLAG